ncbi:MAG TPA: DUF1553 domain-containing protein [Chthonomonadaceae bacterium]|nr:DUF1553 domain-containing protein [Chthonomonadaceae bacterium]
MGNVKTAVMAALGLGGFALVCGLALPARSAEGPKRAVDFDRDVRPILAENCFKCHGFDAGQRQAGLRLDVPEEATKKLASGKTALVPGNLAASELAQRITATGPMQMPPAYSGKKLKPAEIETLKRWIAQGARYAPHWSFVPPKRPPLPPVKDAAWVRNPIDRFILARLEQEGLHPSPEADRRTLLRRLSFDLTGLPPTPAEVEAFLADKSPNAYEKQVDRLLASPHYGERMAQQWLDLARYADTHGYHIDSGRTMWRWRDWVLAAYNKNMPYDQFTIEQIAGDLLPNATLDQKIATGFNRNHPITLEGGAIPEEYLANYVFDRIDTTATAFMGLTLRCAQCHDHKYDPITQKDYYRFYAFFDNIAEQGLDGYKGNAAPFIKAPLPGQQEQLDAYGANVKQAEQAVKARIAETAPALAAWEKEVQPTLGKAEIVPAGLVAHYSLDEGKGEQARDAVGTQPVALKNKAAWDTGKLGGALKFEGEAYCDGGAVLGFERTEKFSYGAWVYPTTGDGMTVLSRMDDGEGLRGWDLFLSGGKVFVHLIHEWDKNVARVATKEAIETNKWTHLFVTYDGSSKAKGIRIYVNGKPVETEITHDTLTDTIRTPKPFLIGKRNGGSPFRGMIDEVRAYNRQLSDAEVAQIADTEAVRQILLTAADKRTDEQKEALARFYLERNDETYRKRMAELADWKKKYSDLDNAIPTTMVMQENEKPRDTFILVRGEYDKHGEKVTAGVPAMLPPLPQGMPANRLALARWLVSPTHPLTARVAVNRYWQMVFGTGLVKTSENFGTQGERPSHPELLDWLATEFIRTGWNVKGMLRLIVTSATYRQSSKVTPELLAKDPEDRLLARAPRYRLPAEMVRDQALAVSGLLVDKLGGPSVKPYQPPGLWEEISFKGGFSEQYYEQDHGEALYRRSLYTFWKRTCPPPALQTFDAPEREFCIVRRSVTNTPLQALVLMNDPTYIEASRKFAERIMTEGGTWPGQRIRFAFRTVVGRPPTQAEQEVLLGIYFKQLTRFRTTKDAATKLLGVGESPRNEKLDATELAAWTALANVLFNLDETITKG